MQEKTPATPGILSVPTAREFDVSVFSGILVPDRCRRGPRHHVHPLAIGMAILLFLAALLVRSWGAAPLILVPGSAVAYVLGVRHTWPPGGGG